MANESDELSVTPEVTKSCTVEIRRHSAGKASSENSDEKVVPHYLRASTGSCHDFCKYGRKHALAVKERRSIPNRATRKQLHQSSEESIDGIMVSVARPRASVDSKPTKEISMVIPRESVDSKTRIPSSDTNMHKLPTKSFDNQQQIGNKVPVKRNKASLVKDKPSLLLKSNISQSKRQEISSTIKKVQSPLTSKKAETPSKSAPKKVETPSKSAPKKVETPSKSTSKKVENPSKSTAKKVENPSKSTSKVKTSSKPTSKIVGTSSQLSPLKVKETKLSEKRVTSLNSNGVTRKQISSKHSSDGSGGQRNSEIKMEKGAGSSKAASKKLMAPLRALSSPKPSLKRVASLNSRKHKSLKIVSHLKNHRAARKFELEEHNNEEVEEKTLYVIKMECENKTLQSDQNANYDDELCLPQLSSPKSSSSSISQSLSQEDQEESEYATSECEQDSFSGNHEIDCMENEGSVEVEKKGKSRKAGVVCSEDKDRQMIKLKFRRGKVVENQVEKNTPRRLKFRRAKVLGEKAKDDAQRKSLKRRDGACADGNGATTDQEKVVLRHQDMQDKKDAQGLLNNVIEETASKLVETRKSKVKALVGAFETVISLQEKKPAANTVS
ncbi:Calmodulin-binding domain, plant [Sesbania bispinosa]|nr:Calmodulin-binding domain, plant [Sesbania bispinosa]